MSETTTGEKCIFREEQRFHQWWIYALVLGTAGFAWYAFLRQVVLRRPLGNRPSPDWLMVLTWLLMGIGFPWLFLSARLVVEVREDGLHYRYYPFHRRWHRLAREEIAEAEARTYRPILEYGGWGIRWGWRGGRAFNVSGNRGVQLRLRDGRRVLFGSRRPEELEVALRKIL
ncbi:DUF6141 family protein [Candidatus Solincola sp.]|jgi:hypothetical protein|nr:DUF6141 family protein [Actinomycetota bacterium]MDI7251664.1 DUF6141 family protein [Actinomycetota bacterium]